jgi:poly-gamma-glutamate capsule biosynthesis protein CapA/YwtB (metallophosphatase superfamily)
VPTVPLLLLALLAAVRGPAPEQSVSLAAVGDVQLSVALRGVDELPGGDPFGLVRPALQADLTVGNLEGPVPAPGAREATRAHGPILRQPEEVGACLRDAGFDLMSLANNHLLDWGVRSVPHTIRNLAEAGVAPSGAWSDPADSFQPVLRTVNGVTIGFLSYTMWLNVVGGRESVGLGHLGTDDALAEIAALRPYVDFVVVQVHWERENDHFTYGNSTELAHRMVDAGADVILGHHAHVLKGLERYRGALIAYSLGNFIFGEVAGAIAQSVVLRLRLVKGAGGVRSVRDVRVVPVTLDGPRCIPRAAEGYRARRILSLLRRCGRPLGTTIDDDGMVRLVDPEADAGALPSRMRGFLAGGRR